MLSLYHISENYRGSKIKNPPNQDLLIIYLSITFANVLELDDTIWGLYMEIMVLKIYGTWLMGLEKKIKNSKSLQVISME